MNFFQHPKTLWILCFSQAWDTFSYYGTQTILVLYFIHNFQLNQHDSYLLYGAYAAFTYSMPTVGGIIADKWLGSQKTLLLGGILNIVGNLCLLSFDRYLFSLGLATALIGSGLFKSNATHLVGTLYPDRDIRKESGFTWSYLSVNVGGTLGPLVYGLVVYAWGWQYGFLCSAVGIAISLTCFIKTWHYWVPTVKPSLLLTSFICSAIIIACFLMSLPFYYPAIINSLILSLFSLAVLYLVINGMKYHGDERRHLLALLTLSFFGMFYYAAGMQVGSSLVLFIQSKVQGHIIHMALPASTISMLYPFFVLALAPFFMWLWPTLANKNILLKTPTKLAIGIFLATLGIVMFALAAYTNWILLGVIVGILLLSAGEITLAPALYTAVSDLAPAKIKITIMGGYLLFLAFGSYLSSILALSSQWVAEKITVATPPFFLQFALIAAFTFIVFLILLFINKRLSKMMR